MKRRSFLQLGLGLGAVPTLSPAHGGPGLFWEERSFIALGLRMRVRLAHHQLALARLAMDVVRDTLHHVEDQMSLYRPDSAICRLNRTGRLHDPHPHLVEILGIAQQVSQRSQGAFDVTVQPLWLAYAAAQRTQRLPDAQTLDAARARVGWQGLQVDHQRIVLERPGMAITLNGIAQGFAADLVKRRLQALGIAHALIDTGEWAVLGRPVPQRPWALGIADPRAEGILARVALDDRCLATSADSTCTFSADHRHHHIFNPHTGDSPLELASVSVLADTAVMADALTKVFFMADARTALQRARDWQVEVLVVSKSGVWEASKGFPLLPA